MKWLGTSGEISHTNKFLSLLNKDEILGKSRCSIGNFTINF